MELRQLVYFEAVVRCGGFSRAAEQLHVAQPAVSAQIRRLEAELGAPLLERTTRRVALTHAGELFLGRARAVLGQLDGARADLAELAAVRRGRVRIGATLVLGSLDLPGSLAQFRRRYPGVTLALRAGLIAELTRQLSAGELDIVLGPLHPELLDGCHARALVEERYVLVTPPGPRAGPTAVALGDFRDETFVCLPEGSGLYAILTGVAAAAGFTPRIQLETHSPASIRELVAAGLGVALLAESAARAIGPAVQVRQLQPAPRRLPIGMITPAGRPLSPATRAWQHYLEQTYGAGGPAPAPA
ncbi:MAG TPA: LysR family transcriptional regulator [Streptosporangiaceae bacterium]|nr:LysR family transcriptional regulator [Streptosporangiaceae bacterium]